MRDAQIQLSILEKVEDDLKSDYSDLNVFLRSKEKSGIKKFKEKGNTFDTNKIKQLFNFSEALLKIIIDFPGLQLAFDNYKENRHHKIRCLLKNKKQKVDFHQVRKRVKDLTYLTEIQQIQPDETNDELVLLKLLGRKLGDWHDIEFFLKELSFIKSEKKKPEEYFREIEAKLKHEQQSIIDEFYRKYEGLNV